MAKYELMFIVRPDVAEEEVDKLVTQMEGVVTGSGGQIEKIDKMGRRRLAYRVERCREGFYVLFTFAGSGDTVREFERKLKVADPVIKFLTIRMDEQLQRGEKFKASLAKKETKSSRSKAGQTAPPPAAEALPGE